MVKSLSPTAAADLTITTLVPLMTLMDVAEIVHDNVWFGKQRLQINAN